MEPSDREIEEMLARARAQSEENAAAPLPSPDRPRRVVLTRMLVQAALLALLLTIAVLLVVGAFGLFDDIW